MLAKSEIKRLFSATENVKHRTELMAAYSCDMRVSEVANLRIQDIDFECGVVTVCQGEWQERPHCGAFGEWNFEKSLISAISVTAVRKLILGISSSSEPLV